MVLKLEIRVSVCSKHIVYFLNIEEKKFRNQISDFRWQEKKEFFFVRKMK